MQDISCSAEVKILKDTFVKKIKLNQVSYVKISLKKISEFAWHIKYKLALHIFTLFIRLKLGI